MSTRLIWRRTTETDSLAFLLLAAFLLRLVIIPLFYDDYNYWAFGVFTNFLLHGQNPYHIVTQDPTLLNINPWRYPPLYLLFTAPALIIQQLSGHTILYLAALKVPLAVADLISTFYVYKILFRFLPHRSALTYSALFALNPLVIFESSAGGFNDPIAIAFTVASVFHLLKYQGRDGSKKQDLTKSALFLGMGIATKIYPVLLIPVLAREAKGRGARLTFVLFSLLPGVVFSTPFLVWDSISYIELLTLRSVGGQHPLFPSLGQGVLGLLVLGGFGVLLMVVYVRNLPLMTRIALTFLWVNLAILSVSFNYMVWGIPFFTLLAAQYRRNMLMPLSPVLTMIASFIFEGSYDALRGSAGLYYWTFHIFHLAVVPTLVTPLIGIIGIWVLTASEGVAAYYFISLIARRNRSSPVKSSKETHGIVTFQIPRKGVLTCFVLIAVVASSWAIVATRASFLPHQYPVIIGSSFQFTDRFHSPLIDYQWVFPGRGSYTINSTEGFVSIGTAQNGTGELFRGWGPMVDGFHSSTSAVASFSFRFTGLSNGSTGMTIANLTDGQLAIQRQTTLNLVYVDQQNNKTIFLNEADENWHNFTMDYFGGDRTLTVDDSNWTLPGGTFNRLILGNISHRANYEGTAEFSSVHVVISDFPAGYQAWWTSILALVAPLAGILLLFVAIGRAAPKKL